MQDKIIAAIAAYLEKNTLIEYVSGESDFQTRYQFAAEQIAAAIAPLVEEGEPDDSQYTEDFLKWRNKYFAKAKPETKQFVSKNIGVYFSCSELESKYERAMNGFKAKK